MSVEAAIHDRWANTAALVALLPAARFVTGTFRDESASDVPYAQLSRESDPTKLRTNSSNRVDDASMRIQVWHTEYAAGKAISDQIISAFDNASWTYATTRIIQSRKVNDFALEEDDGGWQFVVDLEVVAQQTG